MFSKSCFLLLSLFFSIPLFYAKSQEQKPFDFSLTAGAGTIGTFVGDPRRVGIIANAGSEFVFPKLRSAIELRLGLGGLFNSYETPFKMEGSSGYSSLAYKVKLFSYGVAYKFLYHLFPESDSYFVFDNEFSWANLDATVTKGDYTSRMKGYFFYTFRIGYDVKYDAFLRLMPWVGISTLNTKPLLNKKGNFFGNEDFPLAFGLTIKIF